MPDPAHGLDPGLEAPNREQCCSPKINSRLKPTRLELPSLRHRACLLPRNQAGRRRKHLPLFPGKAQGFGEGQGSPFCVLQSHPRPHKGAHKAHLSCCSRPDGTVPASSRGEIPCRGTGRAPALGPSPGIKKGHFSLRKHIVVISYIW